MNIREKFSNPQFEQDHFRARQLASDCDRVQLTEIAAQALILHEMLHENCGTTDEWPLDLVARDEESAKKLVATLEDLQEALEGKI